MGFFRSERQIKQETEATDDLVAAVWRILDATGGSESWVHDCVRNGILSWRAAHRR
jgi:Arc/MetJ family transcription regulator